MKKDNVNTANTESVQKVDRRKTMPHLFKPGQSGNPKGKPKGSFSLVAMIKAALQTKAEIDGKKIDKTYAQLFVDKVLKKTAQEGDVNLIKEIMAHIDGSPARKIDVTSGGEPISGFNYIVPEEGE